MQYLTFVVAAAGLISTSLAGPIPAGYQWSVSNWIAGCSDEYCTYSFTVSGPQNGNIPAFKARCAGPDAGGFGDCKILSSSQEVEVSAKLRHQANPSEPTGPANMKLAFEYTLQESGVDMTYFGHYPATYNKGNSGVAGRTFMITPSRATGS